MDAKDSVEVTIAHTEQDSLLEDQVSESWIQVSSLAPVPLHPFPFGRILAVLFSFICFLLCFCESLTVTAFLFILYSSCE